MFNITPIYTGMGQPAPRRTSWLARLGSLFGQDRALAYRGTGQPAIARAGLLVTPAPAYQQKPIMMQPSGSGNESTMSSVSKRGTRRDRTPEGVQPDRAEIERIPRALQG